MAELSKFEKKDFEVEDHEVVSLKHKLDDMEISKGALQSELADMVRQHQKNRDKISSLLSKNSRLVTESDALAATVKTQNGDFVSARKSIEELEASHKEAMKLIGEEKEDLKRSLEETKSTLGQLEEESLKLFEEGYRECWSRGEARGLDMEPDKFEAYLGELQGRIRKGVQESEKSTGADVNDV